MNAPPATGRRFIMKWKFSAITVMIPAAIANAMAEPTGPAVGRNRFPGMTKAPHPTIPPNARLHSSNAESFGVSFAFMAMRDRPCCYRRLKRRPIRSMQLSGGRNTAVQKRWRAERPLVGEVEMGVKVLFMGSSQSYVGSCALETVSDMQHVGRL